MKERRRRKRERGKGRKEERKAQQAGKGVGMSEPGGGISGEERRRGEVRALGRGKKGWVEKGEVGGQGWWRRGTRCGKG